MKPAQNHMRPVSSSARTLLAACAMVGFALNASAATPLYQWNFDAADGANTGTASGGTLSANVGGATTGAFTGTGVSGSGGDRSYHASNANDNWFGSDLGNAAAVSSVDLSSLDQLTITLWVKRSGGNNADLLNIGSTATPDSSSNPGITLGLNGNWDNGIRFGINGQNAWSGDLWGAGYTSDWVFLAISYNGLNGGQWGQEIMATQYGVTNNNAAVITGTTTVSASVAQGLLIHDGGWWNSPGAPTVGSTATAFLGNNAAGTSGFSGDIDDIRIYSGLLTVSEIEAVRLEAVAIPEPSAAALLLGGFGLVAALGRRPGKRR